MEATFLFPLLRGADFIQISDLVLKSGVCYLKESLKKQIKKQTTMNLSETINADIKKAMLAREKEKLEALRAVKSAIMLEATKDGSGEVSEETALAIVQKLVKQRKDASSIFKEQGREDLAKDEDFQIEVLSVYLPVQMGEDEVRKVVQDTIAQVGAAGPSDMGKIMGPVMGKLKGKADGKLISALVKECLA